MRFAHIADCHLGGWRQPEMQALNLESFERAIDKCISERVDFVLIAGDLFDAAMPPVEILKSAMSKFRELHNSNIPCYLVPGSHDFSVSGKTFLDVIEKAGFCRIAKMEERENELWPELIEEKDFIIAGVPGKKTGLEQNYFKKLKFELENYKNKLKIFVLHSTITEAKPEEMSFVESVDIKDLPSGFDYYAAGHLHILFRHPCGEGILVYPGPTFPNSVDELQKLRQGGFYILEADNGKIIKENKMDLPTKELMILEVDADGLSSTDANSKILGELGKNEDALRGKILILKLRGRLASGKTADIDFEKIREKTKEAYALLRSTSGLTTSELKLELPEAVGPEQIEQVVIDEYTKSNKDNKEFSSFTEIIPLLIAALGTSKQEGERGETFEKRVFESANAVLKIK
jgi:exonuclease SbcD